jgi:hypothetical protein
MPRLIKAVSVTVLAAASLFVACSSNDANVAASSATSSSSSSSSGDMSFGASACGACVAMSCAAQVTDCNADPDCAAWLACVDKCGVNAAGNADPLCESLCAPGTTTSAHAAESAFNRCRSDGPGAACAACGAKPSNCTNPIAAQTCAPSNDPDKCFRCEDTHCCDTYAKYAANPDAVDFFKKCYQPCVTGGGKTCGVDCFMKYPKGVDDVVARLACLDLNCFDQDSCNNNPVDPCVKCVNEKCCDASAALSGKTSGFLIQECAYPCKDAACFDACKKKYPAAKDEFDAFADCGFTHCYDVCGM